MKVINELIKEHKSYGLQLEDIVIKTDDIPNTNENYYAPIIPSATGGDFNYLTDKCSNVYAKYDELMAKYPNYIKRTLLGNDQSGILPVYKYDFIPEYVGIGSDTTPPPADLKIILGTSIHGYSNDGDNKVMTYALYYFLKDMCENWKRSAFLTYARFNIQFVIIPIQNPWGFNNDSRYNSNNVDINRNFNCNWYNFVDSAKGTAPFSEVETRYIRQVIESNYDAVYYGDIHSRGSQAVIADNNLFLYVAPDATSSKYIGQKVCGKMNFLTEGVYGLTGNKGNISIYSDRPSSYTWASQLLGLESANPEGFAKFKTYGSHSTEVMTLNTEYVGNLINTIVKHSKTNPKFAKNNDISRVGLVAEYKFNESTGQVLKDSSGNNNNGQLGVTTGVDSNDPTWSSNGLLFNGTEFDFVDCGNGESLNVDGEFYIECVIKSTNGGYIVAKNNTATTDMQYGITHDATARKIQCILNGAVRGESSNGSVPLNEFMHIGVQYNKEDIQIFINNVQYGVPAIYTESITKTSHALSIGRRKPNNVNFNGEIAYLNIYNRTLEGKERLKNYLYLKETLKSRGISI